MVIFIRVERNYNPTNFAPDLILLMWRACETNLNEKLSTIIIIKLVSWVPSYFHPIRNGHFSSLKEERVPANTNDLIISNWIVRDQIFVKKISLCLRHEHRWCFLLKVKNNNIPYFHLVLIEWVKATTDYTSSFYINNNKSFWWSEKLGVLLSCLVSINDSFMAMKYVSLAHGCTICGYSVSLRCSQRSASCRVTRLGYQN